jgi:hypothetical protein
MGVGLYWGVGVSVGWGVGEMVWVGVMVNVGGPGVQVTVGVAEGGEVGVEEEVGVALAGTSVVPPGRPVRLGVLEGVTVQVAVLRPGFDVLAAGTVGRGGQVGVGLRVGVAVGLGVAVGTEAMLIGVEVEPQPDRTLATRYRLAKTKIALARKGLCLIFLYKTFQK